MHFPDDGLLDVFGVVPVGRVQEDRESCRAFHERADRAFVGRAAHISPRVAYSTPSNTHLSTWPSHQSARRCDDHWNPPLPDYATPYVANALRTVGLNLNGTVMSPAEAASRASVGPVMVVVPIVVLLVAYMLLSRFRREGVERK